MSAYIVDRHHIAYLVKFAEARRLLQRIDVNAVELANMLAAENMASINGRYPDTVHNLADAPGDIETLEPFTVTEMFEYRWSGFDPVQVLKAVRCYEYQSSEHSGWETSSAKRAIRMIQTAAINALPGMDEAEWGAPMPNTRRARA